MNKIKIIQICKIWKKAIQKIKKWILNNKNYFQIKMNKVK